MNYSFEQLAMALYLIHELEQTEIARKRQGTPVPWLEYAEAVELLTERLIWPQGMAAGVLDALQKINCIRKSLKGGFIKPLLPLVPACIKAQLKAADEKKLEGAA